MRPSLFFPPREYRLPSLGSGRKAGLELRFKKMHYFSRPVKGVTNKTSSTGYHNHLHSPSFVTHRCSREGHIHIHQCGKTTQRYILCHMCGDLKNWICKEGKSRRDAIQDWQEHYPTMESAASSCWKRQSNEHRWHSTAQNTMSKWKRIPPGKRSNASSHVWSPAWNTSNGNKETIIQWAHIRPYPLKSTTKY